MTQSNCPASIQGVMLRLARLAADGTTPAAAGNMYVTDAFTTLTIEPEVDEGTDYSDKNAAGGYCLNYKDADRVKYLNLELAICNPDPEIHELLLGGTLVVASGNTTGWAHPSDSASPSNGVSLEIWSKAIVGAAAPATLPYFQWVIPMTKGWVLGSREISNGKLTVTFQSGKGYDNTGFGNGPNNDVLWTPTSPKLSYNRVATIPTAVCGAQATPTQT